MSLLFLVLIASIATYFYLKSTAEISQILCLATLAISWLLAIFIVPWEVQLLILMLIMIGTRKVSLSKPPQLS